MPVTSSVARQPQASPDNENVTESAWWDWKSNNITKQVLKTRWKSGSHYAWSKVSAQTVWGALMAVRVCFAKAGWPQAGGIYLVSLGGPLSRAHGQAAHGGGGGGGEARGVSEGHIVAGQNERGFNVEGWGIGIRRSGMRRITHGAVFGKMQAARLRVGVDIEWGRGGRGRRGWGWLGLEKEWAKACPAQGWRRGAGRLGLGTGGDWPSAGRGLGVEVVRAGMGGRGRVRRGWPLLRVGRIDIWGIRPIGRHIVWAADIENNKEQTQERELWSTAHAWQRNRKVDV